MTDKVALTLDSAEVDGTLFTRGAVRIVPSFTRLPLPDDQRLLEHAAARAVFGCDGTPPVVDLYPNDLIGPRQDDGTPGWSYTITYDDCPGNPPPWSFYLLSTLGPGQRLSGLAQSPVAAPGALYLPMPQNTPAPGNVPVVTSVSPLVIQFQASAAEDKNFTMPFSIAGTVDVPHNLGKYPSVTVIDSAGDQVDGDVTYTGLNTLTLTFSAPFSGTVTCN